MKPVYIVHCAAVTPLGDTLDTTWQALNASRSAIGPLERFATKSYVTSLAATIPVLEARDGSLLYDLLERLLLQLPALPQDCRLLTATTKGPIDLLEQACRTTPSPALTPAMLPEAMTGWLQQRLGLAGEARNINAACASSTAALAQAAASIGAGLADTVLVCCADLVSEFVFSGFSALQALSPAAARPFDPGRQGLTLGEAAASLLLMSEEAVARSGLTPLARLCGWGAANDANHITAPARDGCGLIEAIGQCLARARQPLEAVAAISAHGTGTVYNDAMEITAFRALWGELVPPFNSIKGAVGHTLGAAGGLEAALAVLSLQHAQLPPTVGLQAAEQTVSSMVMSRVQKVGGDLILSTNSGFGGVNAAIAISRVEPLVTGGNA
ncbi:MAG: beta-ketoacyl-[acyl-carrier-protein] synthase family protein [Desulfuromonadaceae bacterium]|nr:beta-ketoacyl-[acyl-carrier-protein] synthase family protein [Desulfuromonadaceae bacterium]